MRSNRVSRDSDWKGTESSPPPIPQIKGKNLEKSHANLVKVQIHFHASITNKCPKLRRSEKKSKLAERERVRIPQGNGSQNSSLADPVSSEEFAKKLLQMPRTLNCLDASTSKQFQIFKKNLSKTTFPVLV